MPGKESHGARILALYEFQAVKTARSVPHQLKSVHQPNLGINQAERRTHVSQNRDTSCKVQVPIWVEVPQAVK